MKKPLIFKTVIALSAAGFILGALLPQAYARHGGRGPKDTDGDGVVSKQEFLDHVEKRFKMKDQDGDGVITLKDVLVKGEVRFNQIDTDQDGSISQDERRNRRRGHRPGASQQ